MPSLDLSSDLDDNVNWGNPTQLDNIAAGSYMLWVKAPADVTAAGTSINTLFQKGLFAAGVNALSCFNTGDGQMLMFRGYSTTEIRVRSPDGFVTANDIQFLGCSWNESGNASEQILFRGTLTTPPVEPASYVEQDAHSGTKSDDSASDLLMGNRTTNLASAWTGLLYWGGIWNTYQSLADVQRMWATGIQTPGQIFGTHCGRVGVGTQHDYIGGLSGTNTGATLGTGHPWALMPGSPIIVPAAAAAAGGFDPVWSAHSQIIQPGMVA